MDSEFVKLVIDFSQRESWVMQVFVVVFATVLLDFFQKRALDRLQKSVEKTENLWDDAFVFALRSPLRVIVWLIGIAYAISIAQHEKAAAIFAAVDPLRDVGVIVVITWFLVRFISQGEQSFIRQRRMAGEEVDQTTADAIDKLLRISVIITSTLVVLQTLGYSISGVLAFGGVGGIALGFAAKDLLANFFGGLMVYLDRPFSVGD